MKKILLLCCLFFAVPAFAQDYYPLQDYGLRKDTLRLELYGGLSLPEDSWGWNSNGRNIDPGSGGGASSEPRSHELGTNGWTAGIGFTRNVYSFFGLGLDANYTQFGDGKKDGTGYYRTGVATGLITGRLTLFPSSAIRPYVPFGIGINRTFAQHKRSSGTHNTIDGTDLAQMLGLGLEFDMEDDMILGVEARYYRVNMADELKEAFGKDHFQHLLVMLKLGFRF